MVLTSKQQAELNAALIEYLAFKGLKGTVESFSKETGTPIPAGGASNDPLDGRKVGALERKWMAVLRLQKQVLDLERTVERMKEEASSSSSFGPRRSSSAVGSSSSASGRSGLPRAPAQFLLQGHRGAVTAIAVHPIFTQVASASEDATIRLWDFESGEYERALKGHTNVVQDLAYNAKGTVLASCSADMTIKLFDLSSFSCFKTLQGHEHSVTGLRFLPSDDFLVSASRDKTIRVWSLETTYCVQVVAAHSDWVRRVAVAAHLIASGSSDHSVRVWNATDPSKVQLVADLRGHSHVVEAVAFAPASLTQLGSVKASDGKTPEEIEASQTEPSSSSYSSSSTTSSSSSTNSNLTVPSFVASASRDKTIKIWHIRTGRCISTLSGHSNWVREIAFHPNGTHLFSVSDDKSIKIWDIVQERCIRTIEDAHGHFVSSAALVDGPELKLITGGVDNVLRIWPSSN